MIKKFCLTTALVCSLASNAVAQSSSDRLLELDPNIIAAANCSGTLLAVSMYNFENGILNEERARVMLRTSAFALFLTGMKHQNVQHFLEYAEDYDTFSIQRYEAVYDDLIDGSYTWTSQAETDVCSARLFEPLINVTEQDLAGAGVDDYFLFKDAIVNSADERFDYILRMMEAMR